MYVQEQSIEIIPLSKVSNNAIEQTLTNDSAKIPSGAAVTAAIAAGSSSAISGGLVLNPSIANLAYSGVYFTATAGENVALGDVCYLKSDGKYYLAKADVATTKMPAVVMATGTINANATGIFLRQGFIRNDTWTSTVFGTMGSLLYTTITGTTGNTVHQTAPVAPGNIIQVIGQTKTIQAAPGGATIADGAAGVVTAGNHIVKVTFVTSAGETLVGTASNTLNAAGSKAIDVTGIPVGGVDVIQRNVYMTEAGGAVYYLVSAAKPTLNNNTATILTINIDDVTLATHSVVPASDTTAKIVLFDPDLTQTAIP